MRRPRAGPVAAVAAGSWRAVGNRFRKYVTPPRPPIEAYTRKVTAPIGNNGITQGVIGAGGAATVSTGPAGVGTRWYPQQITLATKTGPNDISTVVGYLGAIAPNNIVFTSYSGGGDIQGLAVPEMQPGDLLIAVWSGGKPGDWAQLTVIGQQEVLVTH